MPEKSRSAINIRVQDTLAARWSKTVKQFDETASQLLEEALDVLDGKNGQHGDPMEKVLHLGANMMNSLQELSTNYQRCNAKLNMTRNRICDLENASVAISAMKKAHSDREADLLGTIHGLREQTKETQVLREELATLKAENQALKRERMDLRKQLKN